MIRFLTVLVLGTATALSAAAEPPAAPAQDVQAIQLADQAPERHIVVPGDTLWSIAGKFLKDPWRWPEVWRLNKEDIKNPHRIYPGNVVVLEKDADGKPRLRVQDGKLLPRIYSEDYKREIPSIPTNVINPFLSTPLIVDANALDNAARIAMTPPDRIFLGRGDIVYVTNADQHTEKWQIYRPGKPVLDPETQALLGFEAYYLGTATQREVGDPATFEIVTAKEEVARGDRLLPAGQPPLVNYAPRKPEFEVDGRIVSVYGGVGEGGRLSIILINKGLSDGLSVGHVLQLQRNVLVRQRDEKGQIEVLKAPDARYGLAFVFRTFDQLSYALVMESAGAVVINDHIRTP